MRGQTSMAGLNTLPMFWPPSTSGHTEHHGHPQWEASGALPTDGSASAGCACTASNPSTGPLVVLLHGFPEFWYAWRHQIPALAAGGYRVLAPDLPGYITSDKPPRVRDCRPRVLAQKVAELIVGLGAASAAVAGHDWGGGLAWLLAMHPDRIQRLVVLNALHPIRFLKGLGSPRQLQRSGYMLAFQLPWLPERLWRPGTSRRCAGPCATSRPGRAPSPPKTSTATSPRPPSPVPWVPQSTTTGPPSAPTRWPKRTPCVAWTPRP
jgi:pimeloyl-ACP methyl ester carboxylesterase